TLIAGNLLALQQKNVKRILAYSSIAHLGYLLVAFIPGSTLSLYAVSFYLLAYFICTLTAFGVITLLSNKSADAEDIDIYKALFWQNPLLAFIFSVSLISLAGIPLTAGFIGKFYILSAALQSGFWLIALILIITSVFGLYYYLRIITVMFSGNKIKVTKDVNPNPIFYATSLIALFILTLLTIGIGVYPAGIMRLMEHLIR
ncbi:MAG: NADH-quinone oxidoreductase subunit N, partial [Daejeonella sp.]